VQNIAYHQCGAKDWAKVSSIGFFASYATAGILGLAFPNQTSGLTQAFIRFLGGAKGGIWTSDQIFWYVLGWNSLVVCIILVMGVLALSFAYPISFGFFVGLTAGTWCYRRGVPFNPWTLVMIPWGTHGWIEVAYIIFASSITMKIGIEIFGIRNRGHHLKHMFSTPRPVPGWKETSKPILKRVLILYLCVIMPAVVFGAFFEAYVTSLIYYWFYPPT
jgi:uncharacterized membrane protein SpoIIM required for sporulation